MQVRMHNSLFFEFLRYSVGAKYVSRYVLLNLSSIICNPGTNLSW